MNNLTYEEAEDMLLDLIFKYQDMKDYEYRIDAIEWTQEAEDEATKEYEDLKSKIIDTMCNNTIVNNGNINLCL